MTIYYVDPDSGSDGNDGLSTGNAFVTSQKAGDTAVAGDAVHLMNTATESLAARIDLDTNSGTNLLPISFYGCDASGDRLGSGHYTIDASGLGAGIAGVRQECTVGNVSDIHMHNVRITGAPGSGYEYYETGSFTAFARFVSCRFDNNGLHGLFPAVSKGVNYIDFFDCEIDNNATDGINRGASTNRSSSYTFERCLIHHNGGNGCNSGDNWQFNNCQIYRNTLMGVQIYREATGVRFINNTIAYNGSDGVGFGHSGTLTNPSYTIDSNAFCFNGGFGYNGYIGWPLLDINRNHFHGNTLGEFAVDDVLTTTPGAYNQSGDPLFTSVVDGSEDFTPLAGSPLIGNGMSGWHMGAVIPAGSGGGSPSGLPVGRLISGGV